MPMYMDIHKNVRKGLSAEEGDRIHQMDLAVQDKYSVKYLNSWYSAADGVVFCLVEAPSKEAAEAVHREAHGFVADEIFEITQGL
jgi:hypothetical protein